MSRSDHNIDWCVNLFNENALYWVKQQTKLKKKKYVRSDADVFEYMDIGQWDKENWMRLLARNLFIFGCSRACFARYRFRLHHNFRLDLSVLSPRTANVCTQRIFDDHNLDGKQSICHIWWHKNAINRLFIELISVFLFSLSFCASHSECRIHGLWTATDNSSWQDWANGGRSGYCSHCDLHMRKWLSSRWREWDLLQHRHGWMASERAIAHLQIV